MYIITENQNSFRSPLRNVTPFNHTEFSEFFFISFINQHSPRAVLREPSVGVKWRRQRRKIARDVRNVIIVKVLVCSDKEQMNAAFVSFWWCFFVLGMWKCPQCHPGTRKRKIYEWCYCYRYSVVFFTGY